MFGYTFSRVVVTEQLSYEIAPVGTFSNMTYDPVVSELIIYYDLELSGPLYTLLDDIVGAHQPNIYYTSDSIYVFNNGLTMSGLTVSIETGSASYYMITDNSGKISWTYSVTVGPTGSAGVMGATGSAGVQGATGIMGATGSAFLNGLTASYQYLTASSNNNVNLNISSNIDTHLYNLTWDGLLGIDKGGLNNSNFTASQFLIASTNSIVSSGYSINNLGTASGDVWSADKIISYINNAIISVGTKAGVVSGASFSGVQKSYNVVFSTPFSSSDYSISIVGNSARSWTILNQSSAGFTIESNTSKDLIGNVYWMCINNGETSTMNKGQVGISINGNGSVISTGVKSYVTIPYSGIITGWELLSTGTGSVVIDVWKDTYANYPPVLSDSICGLDKPTLTSQLKNNNNNLTAWSTTVSEGDIVAFNVESASIVTQVTLTLKINKI